MLVVNLFGAGQAALLEQPLEGFPNHQVWLLLAYLLLNKGQAHNRERLAAVFWGESPAQAARKNLRNTLWRLRQVFLLAGLDPDAYLKIEAESVAMREDAPRQVDIEQFEAAAPLLQMSEVDLQPEHVTSLEAAADLYSGDLLESIYDDWCLYERERLRLIYLNILSHLIAYHAQRQQYGQGLTYAQRLLRCDNTREDVHRQVMWLYWRSGNRSAALAQYKLCCQVLRDEVGVAPMAYTRQLYEDMLHEAGAGPVWNGVPAVDFLPAAESALQQLGYLKKALEQTNLQLARIESLIHQALAGLPRR